MEEKELYRLLEGCRKGKRKSQDQLYQLFYGYAMSVCLRYSKTYEEAVEIVNDGFIKIFTKIEKYTQGLSFKGWVRKVMIHAAIDYYRRNEKFYNSLDISHAHYETSEESAIDQMSEQEIIQAIQQLPPSYRMVFNLYVLEGYNHEEIGNLLNISTGTSKSNLAVARNKLKKILLQERGSTLHYKQGGHER